MEATPELPDDVESLKSLLVTHLQTMREQSETMRGLEHNNQILTRLAFGRRSTAAAAEGASCSRTCSCRNSRGGQPPGRAAGVVASIEVAATRGGQKASQRVPAHLRWCGTISELKAEDLTCAWGATYGSSVKRSRGLERVETAVVHELVRKEVCLRQLQGRGSHGAWRGKVIEKDCSVRVPVHVIVERFGNHLPYYLLEKQYERG